MKIVIAGDIHMAGRYLDRLNSTGQVDLLVLNGDLTNFGRAAEAEIVLEDACAVSPCVLAQFGNLDRPEVNDYLEAAGLNLHKQAKLINDQICLIRAGGSNSTPFSTPSEFSEEQLLEFAETGYDQARKLLAPPTAVAKNKIPLILVSHTPPIDTIVDRLHNGTSVGSQAIRKFIEDSQPDLCVCGHIHEAAGAELIGRTTIYNPGALSGGGWLEIDIENSELQATLHE
ncbi:MAG: metallophosphoesterase [Desulfocapsaceae bacterium]